MGSPPRIGLFGGTFNPVHHGHLRLALDLVDSLGLDEMRLIPCHLPAHRDNPEVSAGMRAEMVRLAIAGETALRLDTSELERPGPSYTVDTLKNLRSQQGPQAVLIWVLGADAFAELCSWKHWRQLLDYAHLVVAARPGWTLPEAGELASFTREHQGGVETLRQQPAGTVVILENPLLDISATRIRALTARGASSRYLLPESVREYIAQQNLYLS